jgi:hypothetical protein
MKVIKESSEEEMIAHFLHGEFYSKRWHSKIAHIINGLGFCENIITQPNLLNNEENFNREDILKYYRGYKYSNEYCIFSKSNFMFSGFPYKATWSWVTFSAKELANQIMTMNYSYWLELTKYTRKFPIAADSIIHQRKKSDYGIFFEYANMFSNKEIVLPPPIIVGQSLNSKLVMLEGHVRLTSYFMQEKAKLDEVEAIVGISKKISNWQYF